jgi:hypothetical protein
MVVERAVAIRRQLGQQLLAHRRREAAGHADVMQGSRVVVQPEQQ